MKTVVRILLSLAVSVFLLALLFHIGETASGQPGLREVLGRILPAYAILYLLCTLAQSLLRAARYQLLLRATSEAVVPGFIHIFLVTLARNTFVDLLPARLGELSYVALLNRGYSVSAQVCLSSLAISFLFDIVALAAILAALAIFAFAHWIPCILAVMTSLVIAAYFFLFPILNFLVAKLEAGAFLKKLATAFSETRRARVLGRTFLLSLGVRVGKYAGFFCMFLAVALPSFPRMAETHPSRVLVALVSAEASSSLPVPTFMSFGAYEAGATAAWSALGAAPADAALCMLAVHIGSQVIDYALGGLGLFVIALLKMPTPSAKQRNRMSLFATALCLGAAVAFAFYENRVNLKKGAVTAPPSGASVQPSILPAPNLPRGFLVWSSNRSGNHDIWKMSLPDMKLDRITTNACAEYYPRISPDGRGIVFARAHREWVSQRNETDWDVYRRDLFTGAEELISSNGVAPTWSDASTIVLEKNGTRVVVHDLQTGAERPLCESGKGNILEGVNMQTPQYNPITKSTAVTFRGAERMTALVDEKNEYRRVAGGCQLFWSPDYSYLFYVGPGGRMKNAFYLLDPVSSKQSLWFDAVGEWSHEYFPKVSNDGHWLVYGAAANGHEHDTADYEIFLWKIGEPFENAVRLTWHTGNDCWPDLYVFGGE